MKARNICMVYLLVGLTTDGFGLSSEEILAEEWKAFKLEHKKSYENELEDRKRMNIFLEHKTKVAQHNQKYYRGEVSYKLGLNEFADLSLEEFTSTLNGFNQSLSRGSDGVPFTRQHRKLPKHVDWRKRQAVTPVKRQGHCGSCWAFSTTGALEGAHKIKTGVLVSLSEQNLIDCSFSHGNHGCHGGNKDNAFRYIRDNGGIDTEKSYPYLGIAYTCRFNDNTIGATDRGFVDLPKEDEEALQEAIARKGPVSVAIDASHHSFMLYRSGVYDEPNCSSESLSHAVLAVGYGTEETGEEYWLVKNSWGVTWGDDGYIKMSRNLDNQCGIATRASYPLV